MAGQATIDGAVPLAWSYWLPLQLILPEGYQEPWNKVLSHSLAEYLLRMLTRALWGPVNDPFTIEFTKAISQWAMLTANFFSFLFSSKLFLFLSFFSYFHYYFLSVIKFWPLILNPCLFSFFSLFYLHWFFYFLSFL